MRRGHHRKIPAPGQNRKRHLFAAVDWREGRILRRDGERREAVTFCTLCEALVRRSRARGRRAVVLVDNARFHRPDQSREVATLLRRHGRWLQVVYLPAYSPEDHPLDHLFRVLRGHVTHNHHRVTLNALQADAEQLLHELDRDPRRVLRIIGSPFALPSQARIVKTA